MIFPGNHGDTIAFGVRDLTERLKVLAYTTQLGRADPWSTEWVASVVRELPHGNLPGVDRLEVDAVFAALKGVRYTFHPGLDRMQTLRKTLELGIADCDEASVALATALSLLNFEVSWAIMGENAETADHIWVQVWLPRGTAAGSAFGQWADLDLTTGPNGNPDSSVVGYSVPPRSRAWWQRVRLTLT